MKVEIHKLFEYLLETASDEPPECFLGFSMADPPALGVYLPDLGPLLRAVRGAMDPGGRVVCSVEHPVLTAPAAAEFVAHDGDVIWPLSHFADEGPRVTNWLADGVVKHHRTAATYVRELVAAGFVVDGLGEWTPNAADLHEHPEWARERHRPFFLLLSARTV